MTDRQPARSGIDKSFVGFAPGFSDEIKLKYQRSRDSSDFNNSYLTLLPQPFTISLAKKTQDLYEDGEVMISLAHAFSYAGSKSIVTGYGRSMNNRARS